jgi:acetylornithine deacetylase/succinyl-diaminopimelate desuccinylase-like protein
MRKYWPLAVAVVLVVLVGAPGRMSRVVPDPARVTTLMTQPAVKAALAGAKAVEPRTLDDQARICEVPAPPFAEAARGELLRQMFVEAGLENVRVDNVGNVLGDRRGGPGARLVVAAHLDTVFPADTPVKVTRDGRFMRGPGIGDNCRGLAVLVAIPRVLDQAGVKTDGPITFVANVGEEGLGDLRGMKELFGVTLKGRVGRFVSIDNAGIHITTVGVGSRRYRVTFKGPGGHSFGDFGVANPANALGRAVAKISEFQVPREPRTTFNVGRIGGGTSVNAIPEDAWMEVDLRSTDETVLGGLEKRLHHVVKAAVDDENARWGSPAAVTVTMELVGDRPGGSVNSASGIVDTAQTVASALRLTAPLSESSTDANFPMSLQIPAIAIGAGGRSSDAHALDETFDITDAWQGTQYAVLLTIALTPP